MTLDFSVDIFHRTGHRRSKLHPVLCRDDLWCAMKHTRLVVIGSWLKCVSSWQRSPGLMGLTSVWQQGSWWIASYGQHTPSILRRIHMLYILFYEWCLLLVLHVWVSCVSCCVALCCVALCCVVLCCVSVVLICCVIVYSVYMFTFKVKGESVWVRVFVCVCGSLVQYFRADYLSSCCPACWVVTQSAAIFITHTHTYRERVRQRKKEKERERKQRRLNSEWKER